MDKLIASSNAEIQTAGMLQLYIANRRDLAKQFERRSVGRNDDRIVELLMPYRKDLRAILKSTKSPHRTALACLLIGFAEDETAIPYLKLLLKSPSSQVRDSAAIALGLFGEREILPELKLIADPDTAQKRYNFVRRETTWAIAAVDRKN